MTCQCTDTVVDLTVARRCIVYILLLPYYNVFVVWAYVPRTPGLAQQIVSVVAEFPCRFCRFLCIFLCRFNAGIRSVCSLLCQHGHLFLAYTSFDLRSLYSPVSHFVGNLLTVACWTWGGLSPGCDVQCLRPPMVLHRVCILVINTDINTPRNFNEIQENEKQVHITIT